MPELIANSLAIAFAWLFAVAGFHKLNSVDWYADLIRHWLTPGMPARFLTRLIAVIELIVAMSLIPPETRAAGLLFMALLLVVYALLMNWQLAKGRADLYCGCTGPASPTTISAALIARNIFCAALAVAASSPSLPLEHTAATAAATLLQAVFLVLLYTGYEQLISNAQLYPGAS